MCNCHQLKVKVAVEWEDSVEYIDVTSNRIWEPASLFLPDSVVPYVEVSSEKWRG